jgi:putative drug exporter of the RND superfamily
VLAGAGAGMKLGGGQLDNTFTIPGSQSQNALNQVKQDFPDSGGTSAQLVFRARAGTTVTTPANAGAIQRALAEASRAPQVAAVIPPQKSHLVTSDGKTAIATVQYKVVGTALDSGSLDALTHIASAADSGTLTTQAGGQAFSNSSSGSGSSEVTGLIIAFAVLAIALASLVAAGMPLLTATTGVITSALALRGLAAALSVSNTAVTLSVMIGLAVGVDYALFILSRHRAQLAAGMPPAESAAVAAGTAGTAVVFAGTTVIIALAALPVVGIPFLTVMGLSAAGTVLAAVLIANTLLPAIFGIAGARLAPKPGSRAARLAIRAAQVGEGGRKPPTWGARWLAMVSRHPVSSLAAVMVVLGVIALPVARLTLALPDNGSAAAGNSQRLAFDTVSKSFGPGYNGPLLVLANLKSASGPAAAQQEAEAVAAKLKGFPGVSAVTPPQLDKAGTAALIDVVPDSAPSDRATSALVTSIRGQSAVIAGATGANVSVTGTTAIDVDVSAKLSSAMVPFAAIVVGLSVLLLLLVFRSLLVPVKAAVGFLLSVGASFGAVVAVFQWGWLAGLLGVPAVGPVASFLPIIVMAVLFGLAMDYEVFLVSRIHEDYARTGDPRHAIVVGGAASARVVVAAALIMTFIFASFVLSSDPIIKPIAFGLAVGVACDALLVRMTAVPAVLALAGKYAWYLPRWLGRLLPDLDIEGSSLQRHLAPHAALSTAGAMNGTRRSGGARLL